MLGFIRVLIACLLGAGVGTLVRHLATRHDKPIPVSAPLQPAAVSPKSAIDAFLGPQKSSDPTRPESKKSELVYVSGVVAKGGRFNLLLSDGRTFIEQDPEVSLVHRNYAIISGAKYFFSRSHDSKLQPKDNEQASAASAPSVNTPVDSRPPPPSPPASAWVLHSDGVSRLVTAPVVGK